jgi:hypothetical protein
MDRSVASVLVAPLVNHNNNHNNREQMRAWWAAELAYGTFDKGALLPFAANYKVVNALLLLFDAVAQALT